MPGLRTAQDATTYGDLAAPTTTRLVAVDDPLRLNRQLLVAALDAVPGLAALDAAEAGPTAMDRVDAAVLSARSLQFGSIGHVTRPKGAMPRPVVVIADNGPVTPCRDSRGLVVVSRNTPLAVIVDCIRPDGTVPADVPRREPAGLDANAALTPREHQVLGLLASGLSPAEVARGLDITTYTARDHIKAIRQKLDRPTIMAAVLEAIRRGVLQLDQA
jgi:DNA-binding CsgD family transcriptional regulator